MSFSIWFVALIGVSQGQCHYWFSGKHDLSPSLIIWELNYWLHHHDFIHPTNNNFTSSQLTISPYRLWVNRLCLNSKYWCTQPGCSNLPDSSCLCFSTGLSNSDTSHESLLPRHPLGSLWWHAQLRIPVRTSEIHLVTNWSQQCVVILKGYCSWSSTSPEAKLLGLKLPAGLIHAFLSVRPFPALTSHHSPNFTFHIWEVARIGLILNKWENIKTCTVEKTNGNWHYEPTELLDSPEMK